MANECPPVDPSNGSCGSPLDLRLAAIESNLLLQKRILDSLNQKYCALYQSAIVSFTINSDMSILAQYANGNTVTLDGGALVTLQSEVASIANTINDRLVGGTLADNGDLSLVRANSSSFLVGNVTDIVNPVRGISIRNDNRIVLTLEDGITQIITDIPIPTTDPDVPSTTALSLLATPVVAFTGTSGAASTVNIAALSGVTVPVGTTHVLLALELEHTDFFGNNLSKDSYSTLTVGGILRLTAGHQHETGDSAITTINALGINSTLCYVPLPSNNIISYALASNFNGATTTPAGAQTTVKGTIKVVGLAQADVQ